MELTLEVRLSLARYIANFAGQMMRDGLHRSLVSEKADGSALTETDLAINAMVIRELIDRDARCQVLGEESSTGEIDLDRPTWVVDPIDGTKPFSAGVGLSTFALSYVVDGQPVVSVVADPWTKNLYAATAESPTTRNGSPVRVCPSSLSAAAVAFETPSPLISVLRPELRHVFAFGASVISGAAVASGGLSALCFGPGKPWDIATTALLVRQAGGVVISRDNLDLHFAEPRVPELVAAATPELAEQLLERWRAFEAQSKS